MGRTRFDHFTRRPVEPRRGPERRDATRGGNSAWWLAGLAVVVAAAVGGFALLPPGPKPTAEATKPAPPPPPPTRPKAKPADDPQAGVAARLRPFCRLIQVRTAAGTDRTIGATDVLPAEPFVVTVLDFDSSLPADFVPTVLVPAVAGLPNLTHLYRMTAPMSAADLAALAATPAAAHIVELDIRLCDLTAETLPVFGRFPAVERLGCSARRATPEVLNGLAALPALRGLYLDAPAALPAGADLTRFAGLPLAEFHLCNGDGGNEKLYAAVGRMPNLTLLSHFRSPASDAELAAVAGSRSLETIRFVPGPLTPTRVDILARVERLRFVDGFDGSAASAAGAKALAGRRPGCRVAWAGGVIAPPPAGFVDERTHAEALHPHVVLGVQWPDGTVTDDVRPADPLPPGPLAVYKIDVTQAEAADPVAARAALLAAVPQLRRVYHLADWNDRLRLRADDLSQVTAAPFARGLTNLFGNFPLTPAAVDRLADRCPDLTGLRFDASTADDATLERLAAKCPKLERVELTGGDLSPRVTAAGATALAGLPRLKSVDVVLSGPAATARLTDLTAAPGLTSLSVAGDLPPGSLDVLKRCRRLIFLRVVPTGDWLTADQVKELAAALPGCHIEWKGGTSLPAAK